MQIAAGFGEPLYTPRFAEPLPISFRKQPPSWNRGRRCRKMGWFSGLAAFLPRSICLRASSVFSSVAGGLKTLSPCFHFAPDIRRISRSCRCLPCVKKGMCPTTSHPKNAAGTCPASGAATPNRSCRSVPCSTGPDTASPSTAP